MVNTLAQALMARRRQPSMRFQQLMPSFQTDPSRILGQQLMQQGVSTAPVRTPLQGLGRLSQALVGAYLQRQAGDRLADREQKLQDQIMSFLPAGATPQQTAIAQAFPNIAAQQMLQGQSKGFTQNVPGGVLYGTETTGPFGNTQQNVSGFAADPKPQATQIITLINPSDPNDFVTGDKNSPAIKNALATNKYQVPSKAGSTVNINQKTETVAQAEAAKAGIKQIEDLRKEVSSERDLVGRLDISLALLEGDTETGPLTQLITPFKSLGKQFGFLNDEQIKNLSNIEILRAAFAYQIPRMRVPGSGATSDFEARLFTQATANMANTPEANKVLILGMKKLAERKREILDLKEKYFKKNSNLLGFAEFEENNSKPIFMKYDTDLQYDQAIESGELKSGDLYYNGKTNTFEIVE